MSIKPELALLIYKSYWKFIKDTIHGLDLENMSEEDFKDTATNFNIPRIGKLHTSYEKVQKYNRKIKYLNQNAKDKGNKADVQSGTGD